MNSDKHNKFIINVTENFVSCTITVLFDLKMIFFVQYMKNNTTNKVFYIEAKQVEAIE